MLTAFYQSIGGSDCETIGDGFLAQPANAISSLAFTLIGVVIVGWAFRARGQERIIRAVFGILMALTGLGSVAFHGTQGPFSQFGHDVTFLVAVWFIAVINVSGLVGWSPAAGWGAFAAGGLVIALSLTAAPWLTNILMVVVVVALVLSDVTMHRLGTVRTKWYVASLVAIAMAVAMFLLGRTGGPLCEPDSLFQGHGIWHLLGAVALGAYFVATSSTRSGAREETHT